MTHNAKIISITKGIFGVLYLPMQEKKQQIAVKKYFQQLTEEFLFNPKLTRKILFIKIPQRLLINFLGLKQIFSKPLNTT